MPEVFGPEDARLLDCLMVGAGSSPVAAASAAVRRARIRGAGVEFSEHRPYQAGDDPARIDWTVEARLRQLVTRVALAEGQTRLHVLVDASASMAAGTPSKLACATRTAAALCYVAVQRRDPAGVSVFAERLRAYLRPAAARVQLFRAFEVLGSAAASGASAIDAALEQYAAVSAGPGLAVVLSDYFEPGLGLRGLQALLHRGLTPVVVQIVAPEEVSPDFEAEMELIDLEEKDLAPVTVDDRAIAAYRERLAEHEASLRAFCVGHGCPWTRLRSDMSLLEVLAALQASGLLTVHS